MAKISIAVLVKEVTVIDPDTKGEVKVSIYKHEDANAMFGIDASFIDQNFDDDEIPMIADPFTSDRFVELYDEYPQFG
jgi:hypothetical protein